MDCDTKFSEVFRGILTQMGVKAVRLPPRSPNLNAHLERIMRSIKEGVPGTYGLFWGEITTESRVFLSNALSC